MTLKTFLETFSYAESWVCLNYNDRITIIGSYDKHMNYINFKNSLNLLNHNIKHIYSRKNFILIDID